MTNARATSTILALILGALAAPAGAHHRQTPPIVPLTTTGDTSLPRTPSGGVVLAVSVGGQIIRLNPFRGDSSAVTTAGDNANPAVSLRGNITATDPDLGDVSIRGGAIAWDSNKNGSGDPGRQIFLSDQDTVVQLTHDPTGTSQNPVLNRLGTVVGFESRGDLANTGNPLAQQVFVSMRDGTIVQVSTGRGTSGNPALSRTGRWVAYDSTSDPVTGNDSGISQIWLANLDTGANAPITAGQGSSRRPAMSSEGRIIAFESTAALGGTKQDTHVSQIFAYDADTGNFAQISNDPTACGGASIISIYGDWRIGFVCGGKGYLYDVRDDQRYQLPIDIGDTSQAVVELGVHFVAVATTANLAVGDAAPSGTTLGHQLYLLNLFKRPPRPVAGKAAWFPHRGVRGGRPGK